MLRSVCPDVRWCGGWRGRSDTSAWMDYNERLERGKCARVCVGWGLVELEGGFHSSGWRTNEGIDMEVNRM